MHFVGFGFQPPKVTLDSVPGAWPLMFLILAVIRVAIDDEILPFLGQSFEWDIRRHLKMPARSHQVLLALGTLTALPWLNHAFGKRFGPVRQGQAIVNADDSSKPAASGACAERMVKTEQGGGWL